MLCLVSQTSPSAGTFLGANWEPNICKDGQNLLKPSSSTHRDLLHQQWRIVFTQIFFFRPDKLKEFRIKIVGIFVRTSNKQTLSYNVNIGIPSIFSSLPPQKTKYIRPGSLFILNWNIGIEIGLSWAGARLFVSVDRRRLSVECKKSDTFILTMSVFSHSAWRIIIPGHVSGGRNLETDLRSLTVSGPDQTNISLMLSWTRLVQLQLNESFVSIQTSDLTP